MPCLSLVRSAPHPHPSVQTYAPGKHFKYGLCTLQPGPLRFREKAPRHGVDPQLPLYPRHVPRHLPVLNAVVPRPGVARLRKAGRTVHGRRWRGLRQGGGPVPRPPSQHDTPPAREPRRITFASHRTLAAAARIMKRRLATTAACATRSTRQAAPSTLASVVRGCGCKPPAARTRCTGCVTCRAAAWPPLSQRSARCLPQLPSLSSRLEHVVCPRRLQPGQLVAHLW